MYVSPYIVGGAFVLTVEFMAIVIYSILHDKDKYK
jgi:hypothetical protein